MTEQDEQQPLKPPLKWAGGKRWLVPHIKPLWEEHQHRRLVEPLCGGLAVALALSPQKAFLNDINPHLINFYRWLKKGLQIEIFMRNDEKAYYSCRRRFNDLSMSGQDKSHATAALFYYFNRTGYNGLCRFNSEGGFNVPFGRHGRISYRRDFTPYRRAFRGWKFTARDFERVPIEAEDFIYADPPYDVEFTKYAKEDFTWEDQVRLSEWLVRHPGPVVLSNQATERIVSLYERLGFSLRFLDAPRNISCNGDRTPAREVLAMKGF